MQPDGLADGYTRSKEMDRPFFFSRSETFHIERRLRRSERTSVNSAKSRA